MFTVVAGFYVSRYAAAGKQNIIERHFTVSPLSKNESSHRQHHILHIVLQT